MIKLRLLILSSILGFVINSNSMDVFASLFDPAKIRDEAAANIARQEALRGAAQVNAEADRIAKERGEALAFIITSVAKLIGKTGLFTFRLLSNPHKTFKRLQRGDIDSWIGCLGLTSISVLTLLYKMNKDYERKKLVDEQNKIFEELRKIERERKEREKREREQEELLKKQKETNPTPSAPPYEDDHQPGLYPVI